MAIAGGSGVAVQRWRRGASGRRSLGQWRGKGRASAEGAEAAQDLGGGQRRGGRHGRRSAGGLARLKARDGGAGVWIVWGKVERPLELLAGFIGAAGFVQQGSQRQARGHGTGAADQRRAQAAFGFGRLTPTAKRSRVAAAGAAPVAFNPATVPLFGS